MKPTLGQVFVLSLGGLMATLALLLVIVFEASQETIVESSERLRDQAARDVGDRVASFLAEAPAKIRQFENEIAQGLVNPHDIATLRVTLFSLLLSNDNLGELSLTYGEMTGFDAEGNIVLAETPRGQISVARELDKVADHLWSRHVYLENGVFVSDRTEQKPGSSLISAPAVREEGKNLIDPTTHLTFKTPARQDVQGEIVPSDLHFSQLDADLPEAQRRVEVSAQKAVFDADGKFLGVLRVGLLAHQLDRAVQLRLAGPGEDDPHHIFICDAQGQLFTRLSPGDPLRESEGELRVAPTNIPREVAAALNSDMLEAIDQDTPAKSGQFIENGQEYFATFRALPETQDWIVGIVAPKSFYLGKLVAIRNRLLLISSAIALLVAFAGTIIVRAVRNAQARITEESLRMNRFDFTPAPSTSAFRDVSAVLEGLEKAKTAMRAMGKYAPVDLVRRLYQAKSEPMLGGEEKQISIMFTDIKDFTTFSEQLAPDALASALGLYLDTMARVIQQETGGTIDKYIGDAIMTIWNAPEPVTDHASMACLAALRCRAAELDLMSKPEWQSLPVFETRFGLHCDSALVGHFGAHDRMNYTAIGDAVNLASRLEGLNKQYGTKIIASERVVENTSNRFVFRLLDLVAVKGKRNAVKIYELLGERGANDHESVVVPAYEEAFNAYLSRDFQKAIGILECQLEDGPSHVLHERCRELSNHPPAADWRGVHTFTSK